VTRRETPRVGEIVLYALDGALAGRVRPAVVLEARGGVLDLAVWLKPEDRTSAREPIRAVLHVAGASRDDAGGPGTWRIKGEVDRGSA
jgi:hypothetical protein